MRDSPQPKPTLDVMARIEPTLDIEQSFFARGARVLAGIDEVGRGALAGPVTVGAVAITPETADVPRGLRDSKLMTAQRREAMVPIIHEWAHAWSLGSATSDEIDRFGIMASLGLAASRALATLAIVPDVVIVDGNTAFIVAEPDGPEIVTYVKADQNIACVAAASVLAKVHRDAVMSELHHQFPHYGWESNKGYGAKAHTEAIQSHGVCDFHRKSWNLTR